MALAATVQTVFCAEVGLCALTGAAVGLVIPIRFVAARARHVLEAAIMAALFGSLFMLGSGWPGEDPADPVPIAAAATSVVLYFSLVTVMARAMVRRNGGAETNEVRG